jgi:hypothetical protein
MRENEVTFLGEESSVKDALNHGDDVCIIMA